MRLSELLVDEWVALPVRSGELAGVLEELLQHLSAVGLVDTDGARAMARELAGASDMVRINESLVVVVAVVEALAGLSISVGLAAGRFRVAADGTEARAVVLALVPEGVAGARKELVPALARVFRDAGRTQDLLETPGAPDVKGLRDLVRTELRPRLTVEDALVPLRYRVYPDTPLEEVVDLMVRRGMHAVPVVGPGHEVLGILTSGDALGYLVRLRGRDHGRESPVDRSPAAKDFMTRTVLCVSEEQPLLEAASMMVNRDVEQLPVVREGELVGFVTRDSVLRALRGPSDSDVLEPHDEPERNVHA